MSSRSFFFFFLTFFFCFSPAASSVAETVTMPLTIEYPQLRSLVVASAFTDPGETRVILNEGGGCTKIIIGNPRYSLDGTHLRLDIRASVQAGQYLGGNCFAPVQWDGFLSFLQIPKVDDETWRLSFQTVSSSIHNSQRGPGNIADFLWNLIRNPIHHYLSAISVNLAPPVSDLKGFLLPLFPPDTLAQAKTMLDSMRPNPVRVTETGLKLDILAEAQPTGMVEEGPVKALDEQQLKQVIASWEAWDAFVVQTIAVLARESLTEDEKQTLLDVLLEVRYRFVEELSANTIGKDFVRDQFVKTWRRLSPIYKNHLGKNPSDNILGYLSFFTASDALIGLDHIGPSLGIEISRDGLLRLLHMLNPEAVGITYDTKVNQRLREALGLPPMPASGIAPAMEINQEIKEIPLEPGDLQNVENTTADEKEVQSPQQAKPRTPVETFPPAMEQELKTWKDQPEQGNPQPAQQDNPENLDNSGNSGKSGDLKAQPNPANPENTENREELRQDNTTPPEVSPSSAPGVSPDPTLPGQEQKIEEFRLTPEELQNEEKPATESSPFSMLLDFFVKSAYGAESRGVPQLKDLRQWLVPREGVEQYLERVRKILGEAVLNTLRKEPLREDRLRFYKNLITSTAWQESCFRQFLISRNNVTYLRSYNGTSVGLMQINERVWRSLYDLNQLRWDIGYNAQAGTEILDLYLKKYVFGRKQKSQALDDVTLAGVVYAMYNGGPGQYDKFLQRLKKNALYESDRLFLEKYSWVKNDRWEQVNKFLNVK